MCCKLRCIALHTQRLSGNAFCNTFASPCCRWSCVPIFSAEPVRTEKMRCTVGRPTTAPTTLLWQIPMLRSSDVVRRLQAGEELDEPCFNTLPAQTPRVCRRSDVNRRCCPGGDLARSGVVDDA